MSDWETHRLSEIITIKHGFAFKGEYFSATTKGPLVLTPGNFSTEGGFKDAKPKYYTGEIPEEYILSPGDLVVTMTDLSKSGDTLGNPALIPEGEIYLHNQRIGLVEIKDPEMVTKNFLNYALRTRQYHNYIIGTCTGSTVKHTSPKRIGEYSFHLPGLKEQEAIASVLGALDSKIAINQHMARTAAELATSRFNLRTKSFNKIPLARIATPILGGTPDRKVSEFWEGDTLWASAKDVTKSESGVLLDTEEKITHSATEQTRAKPVPEGSVIITARGTVGAVARIIKAATLNQSCYAFIPGYITRSTLYEIVLMASRESINVSHGTVFSTLNMKSFEHLLVPSIDKTQAIIIEQEIHPLHRSVESALQESRKLAELRDTLLPQLMSGKLRVKDAEKIVEDNV